MSLPVSVCIITRNEEKNITRCLTSLKQYGFELVVVDTGSTDGTKDKAAEFTDRVFDYPWDDDFAAARNFSLSKASNDWIFIIDSDEWVEEIDTEEMDYFMHHLQKAAGSVTRVNKVGTPENPGQTTDHTERFFDRRVYRYEGLIHEQLRPKFGVRGRTLETYLMKITLGHDGYCMDDEARERKADRNYKLLLRELETGVDNPYIYYQLGKACDIKGDTSGAVRYYQKGLSFRPDPQLAYTEAMITACGNDLTENGEPEKAAELAGYSDALGDCADYDVMLGDAYLAMNTPGTRRKARHCFHMAQQAERVTAKGAGDIIPAGRLALMDKDPAGLADPDEKLISIIIPCYNAEKFVRKCFDSIKVQTIGIEHLQVIFVDDASTDGTWELLQTFEKEAPDSVCIIHCDENGRQGRARNIGLTYAVAEYIQYVDADDWIENDMCRGMYNDAERNGSEIVCCNGVRDNDNGTLCTYPDLTADTGTDKRLLIDDDDKRRSFLLTSAMGGVTCNKLISREFIISNDISFPEKLAYEDNYWYNILYLYAEHVYIDSHRYYHYYYNPSSTVASTNQGYHEDMLTVNRLKWEMWEERGFLEKFRHELEIDFLYSAYLGYLRIIFCRFEQSRYDLFLNLKAFIVRYIPDYRMNPLIGSDFSEFDRLLLELLVTDVNENEFLAVKKYALQYWNKAVDKN